MNYSDVKKFYITLSIAEVANKIIFFNSEDGRTMFLDQLVRGILGLYSKWDTCDIETFKFAVQTHLNECLNDSTITDLYGKQWFAKSENMLDIFKLFENMADD